MSTAVLRARRRVRASRLGTGDWAGRVGWILLLTVVLIAVFGPSFVPGSVTASVGIPGTGPSTSDPFGLDFLGRDVLSRVLSGGRLALVLGGTITILTYAVGVTVGLVAGYSSSIVDPLLMRTVDVFLSFPAMLIMLLSVTAYGGGRAVLVGAAVLVLFPGVARIVRTATLEVATRGYVEAAMARGERTVAILRREILPNIVSPIMADVGIRFSWAIILIASVNYLGLGLQPPTADWGLMVSENRGVILSNPAAVVAPAVMLGVIIVAVNLVADSYVRRLGRTIEDGP